MNFTAPLCQPDWALPAALVALALLAAVLILVMVLPRDGRIRLSREKFDPMAQPFGDQPRMPS